MRTLKTRWASVAAGRKVSLSTASGITGFLPEKIIDYLQRRTCTRMEHGTREHINNFAVIHACTKKIKDVVGMKCGSTCLPSLRGWGLKGDDVRGWNHP